MRHIYDDNGTPENSMGVSIMQKTIAYFVIGEPTVLRMEHFGKYCSEVEFGV
jgi:hypothetical protein